MSIMADSIEGNGIEENVTPPEVVHLLLVLVNLHILMVKVQRQEKKTTDDQNSSATIVLLYFKLVHQFYHTSFIVHEVKM